MSSVDSDGRLANAAAPAILYDPRNVRYLAPHLSKLVNYEAYYAFLLAAWRVSAHVRMVSAEDGREIFTCTAARYDVTINPVIDPIDIAIQSVLSLLKFRDISLARTEYEVGREIVLRLPIARRNLLETASEDAHRDLDRGTDPMEAPGSSADDRSSATPPSR